MGPKKKPKVYTPEDRKRLMALVQQSVKTGSTILAATKEHGISHNNYYSWIKATKKPKTPYNRSKRPQDGPIHLSIPMDQPFNRTLAMSLLTALTEVLK